MADSQQNKFYFPALEYGPVSHAVGKITHILLNEGNWEIISQGEISISKKIKAQFVRLSDGQAIIITKRKKVIRPESIDGVLLLDKNGKNGKWESHKLIDIFKIEMIKKGLINISNEISSSWSEKFNYQVEQIDSSGEMIKTGLRPPQIGGLHAIGAHWSINNDPATIVMPTGTGKTETMLASLIAYNIGKVLIIVPANALREQTANKFKSLGLLRSLGNVPLDIRNPIVGIINHRPTNEEQLDIFKKCNVVISTMSALVSSEETFPLHELLAKYVDTLFVDEAHHLPAESWSRLKDQFKGKNVLQFTATPYRRDGKLVEGKPIFNYPLSSAQRDGYFKKIHFHSVYEINPDEADKVIAVEALKKLNEDISKGYDHLMMVRCDNITKARSLFKLYSSLGANPVIAHSEMSGSSESIRKLRDRESRVLVCVDMFGEGFDLPQLKVAAIHDTHKSLAILLQFTGRFTRSAGENIGDATVIANTANQNVSDALERIYREDADWNLLLSEYSSEASRSHAELIEFLNSSIKLDNPEDEKDQKISHHILKPKLSTLVYNAVSYQPKKFFEGLPKTSIVKGVWLNNKSNTLFFVTKSKPDIDWTRSKEIFDVQWDLFVIHYSSTQNYLYLASSDKSSFFEKIAFAVGATSQVSGDVIFKSLGRINRLVFQNVGVKKFGRKNLSFAMYTGTDVKQALSMTETGSSIKSNLSGTGWENGEPVAIGCSYKGRIWSKDVGSIPEFIKWCEPIGDKLLDPNIDTRQIYNNVLIPREVKELPDKEILSIDWPPELIKLAEDRIVLIKNDIEYPLFKIEIRFKERIQSQNTIQFEIIEQNDQILETLSLIIGGDSGYAILKNSPNALNIKIGNKTFALVDYLMDYPPIIRFVDLSEMYGNHLIESDTVTTFSFPDENLEAWDWSDVDIKKESIWKNGVQRTNSIQWNTAQKYLAEGFTLVFDDDSAGEAADLVCMKEENNYIRLALVHCKFTTNDSSGERVKDVVEVCSQAIRSSKWKWKFQDLCKHLKHRENTLNQNRSSRFILGNGADINNFSRIWRYKPIKAEIVVVQPGLSIANITADQKAVLASAYTFLKETVDVELDVKCSS